LECRIARQYGGIMGILRTSILTSTALLATCLASFPQSIIVVRHAERAGGMSSAVGLSDAGRCRAGVLARMLAGTGVKRIFATEVGRTQQTAEPLAQKLGIRVEVLPAKDTPALVNKLRELHPGDAALVVGHSNTVPDIVRLLGGGTVPPLADDEYDRLYVITLDGGRATAVLLRYPGCPM
jgi:broad specificity phosphatase PhoE